MLRVLSLLLLVAKSASIIVLLFLLQELSKPVLFSIVPGAGDLAVQGGFGDAEPADGLFPVVVEDILLYYCISTPQTDTYACLMRIVGGFGSHVRSFLVRVVGGGTNGLVWVSCDYHQGQIGIM